MDAEILPLASRIPVSMASLLRSDSVKPLRNNSSCERANIHHQHHLVGQICIQTFFLGLSYIKMVKNTKP